MPHVPTNKPYVRDNVAVGVMRLSAEEYATSVVAAEQQVMYQLSLRMYEFMQKHPDSINHMTITRWEWRECDDVETVFELRAEARFSYEEHLATTYTHHIPAPPNEYWAEPAEPRALTREAVEAFVQHVRTVEIPPMDHPTREALLRMVNLDARF